MIVIDIRSGRCRATSRGSWPRGRDLAKMPGRCLIIVVITHYSILYYVILYYMFMYIHIYIYIYVYIHIIYASLSLYIYIYICIYIYVYIHIYIYIYIHPTAHGFAPGRAGAKRAGLQRPAFRAARHAI